MDFVPAPNADPSDPDYPLVPYWDRNPSIGLVGATLPAAAVNALLFELRNVIVEAGLTPDGGDLTQVAEAVRRLGEPPVITADLTITVPGDHPTIAAAIAWLRGFFIASGVTVTVQLASGTYTLSDPVDGHPQGEQVIIRGAPLTGVFPDKDAFAVTGHSGAARVADAATNLAMLNDRFATRIVADGYAFRPRPGLSITLRHLLITGDGTASAVEAYGARVFVNQCAIHGFGHGVSTLRGGLTQVDDGITISGCAGDGWQIKDTAFGFVDTATICVTVGNAGCGIRVTSGASLVSEAGVNQMSGGNGETGILADNFGSIILAGGATARLNTLYGVSSQQQSYVLARGATITNNGDAGARANGSGFLDISNAAAISNNGSYGVASATGSRVVAGNIVAMTGNGGVNFRASNYSHVYAVGAAGTGSSSPTADAIGNANSLVQITS